MDTSPPLPRDLLAVPAGAAALLGVGAGAAAVGGVPPVLLLSACALVTAVACRAGRVTAAPPLALIAWMTAAAFSGPPFGQLRPAEPGSASVALVVSLAALAGAAAGRFGGPARRGARTLDDVTLLSGLATALDRRRQLVGFALGVTLLPALTAVLAAAGARLSLADDLLFYLLVVVAVTVVGGVWPAIGAAVAANLLLNFFFTRPYHTFTISRPDNLLAVVLFTVVAVAVSGLVHAADRQALHARRSRAESEALLRLARTVLTSEDTVAAVLASLHATLGVGARLLERAGNTWVTVAAAGPTDGPETLRVPVRNDLTLVVHGPPSSTGLPGSQRLLDAAAWQCAAALDRDRLRIQAAQSEALAAGNRMRTALLAAVSHDLRTPLASIKASISSLREPDIVWTPTDQAGLHETIEEATDRLHALVANLLDMSRVQTGAVQPYLQPGALDEIASAALRDVATGPAITVDVPEHLPLVLTDRGLVERALANLLTNAVRHTRPGSTVEVVARHRADGVVLDVIDHGPGVPEADRDRIFEPFQRLGDTNPSTGVGLGLAVAKGFLDAVGGELQARDTPGGGLTMRMRLPVAALPARPARPEPVTP